ncbi:MAG TPA: hypothetical protein VGE74_29590, partial [Gemmata sp.]
GQLTEQVGVPKRPERRSCFATNSSARIAHQKVSDLVSSLTAMAKGNRSRPLIGGLLASAGWEPQIRV